MTNKTQKERIIFKLQRDGYITRNECLPRFISSLGAIICTLKKEGWKFKTEEVGGDYRYTVVQSMDEKAKESIETKERVGYGVLEVHQSQVQQAGNDTVLHLFNY